MPPRLAAIVGPLKGAIFPVIEDVSIGRDTSNQVCLSSALVSRRHCTIRNTNGKFEITDLESYNGTQVNGMSVTTGILKHGDQITIGDSRFAFLVEAEDATDQADLADLADLVELYEGELSASTIRLERGQALYLNPEKAIRASSTNQRVARDLAALLKISTKINSIRDINALQHNLLELIFEVVPAEGGAVLLKGEEGEPYRLAVSLSREGGANQKVQVSRTIVHQVFSQGVAVLSNNVLDEETWSSAESLVASQARSLLCTPITLFDHTLGVIYLVSSSGTDSLDEGHLQLVTAISSIAAIALENARHFEQLDYENQLLRADLSLQHNMIGEGPKMRTVYQYISKIAPTNSTALIRGESGTGKELAARAIQQNSSRAKRPFVAINCAVLTEHLLESELFGHERGAFTGAVAQKKGKLELADGGTVFLDEIGEMATALQAKLLRVLQEREFERVGGTRSIKLDIRVIAATNRDLEKDVSAGTFRQDLYYRLNVVSFEMPPLRERREDIPQLAKYFVDKYSNLCNRKVRGVSPTALAYLNSYDWPGNVRELENTIERAVVLGSTEYILPEDLPDVILDTKPAAGVTDVKYQNAVTGMKRELILSAFDEAHGSHAEAAKLLGMHPNNLHRLIKNLDLRELLKKGSSHDLSRGA
ncbi:MAG: sigma 54-interacting transcriptional regulator [Pyrinomonadaceae bacterium]